MKKPSKKKLPKKNALKQTQKINRQIIKDKYFNLFGLSVIVVLGVIIYSNSFNCSFHFDDSVRIVYNSSIRNLADIKSWWDSYPARPVSMLSFALNYHFSQLNVRYYR